MDALLVSAYLYEYQVDSEKMNLWSFWVTNIDDSSLRHPNLFETKPLKLSLTKSDFLMNVTLETTCTHCIG